MSSLYLEEITRVKDLLQLMGRGAKRSLGQNFLVNSQKIELIVKQLKNFEHQMVVEVGPGLGALTLRLKENSQKLVLIEMDHQFADYWQGQGLEVVRADALKMDWSTLKLQKAVLISNLPYQIAGRLVVDKCVDPGGLTGMILMFQKEVAKRLLAKPKTEDYSLLTVMAQSFWKMENLTELGPNDYFPPPKVASRVVLFRRKEPKVSLNSAAYLNFVKVSFSQKRKFLKKSLNTLVSEETVLTSFKELGISEKARPEELAVEQFVDLFEKLGLNKN